MARMLKVLLFLCVTTAFAAAAPSKKNPDVERAVKAELVGKVFTTKILVGSYIPCPPDVNPWGRKDAIKPVDTEFSPDGSIRYFARANCFIPNGFAQDFRRFYVTGGLSGQIDPGTSVRVLSVDFKEDRIEVNLNANSNVFGGGTGKIKYMLGAEYLTWSTEQLMEVIARGILIPTYEKLVQLKTEFEALHAGLQEAESKYNSPAADTHTKLVNAIALRDLLEKLQKNRADFTAMGKSDPQPENYSNKLSALTAEIDLLSEQARQERVAQVRDKLKAQLADLSEIQSAIRQKSPSTQAESQQRFDMLARYSVLLDERQKLLLGLKNENEAPTAEENKFIDDGKAEIETARRSLELGHQQLELADLTSQYGQLTKKRAQMLDAYSRAFGTASEKAKLQDLVAVLGQMVTNRDQAAALGDRTAAAQLIKCRTEAEKFKRK